MTPASISLLTICGLEELESHRSRGVSHVLSITDPGWPEPHAFEAYDRHHRTKLEFHDVIEPFSNHVLPQPEHVEAILAFGESLADAQEEGREGHLLVHCHMGVSRSTAAMAAILAQANPDADAERVVRHIEEIRPQVWPNSRMIGFADRMLGRDGELTEAVRRLYGRRLLASPATGDFMRQNGRGREVEMAIAPKGEER
ncbi:MAG TPA: protein-tyrosine phosphatase family protein [Mesorhizobium sp.]|nr:protein-tyrosine phosphatase family protein [Mesorhizobium sp.]